MAKNHDPKELEFESEKAVIVAQKTRMPNEVIRSYYTNTLLDEQVQTLVLHKAAQGEFKDLGEKSGLEVTFTVKEFGKIFEKKGESMYEYLFMSSLRMNDKKFVIEDGKGNFVIDSLFPHMKYENGMMRVRIGELGRKAILQKKDFTLIDISIIKLLKKVETVRLYEYLREKAFVNKEGLPPAGVEITRKGAFEITASFEELQIRTGVACMNEKAKVYLSTHKGDYEGTLRIIPLQGRKYNVWRDFRRRILDPAIDNISRLTDIDVSYFSPKRKNDKVVIFTVSYKAGLNVCEDSDVYRQDVLPDDGKTDVILNIARLISEQLSFDELKAIAEAADYDLEVIREKYKICRENKTKPRSMTSWMISAIKEDYKRETHDIKKQSQEKKKSRKAKTDVEEFKQLQQLAITDATFFDFDKEADEGVLTKALAVVEHSNGIPKEAAWDPHLIKDIVQSLIFWDERKAMIDYMVSGGQVEKSDLIVRETYLLALKCCVLMMTALEPIRFGGRYMNYSQAIDRFNRQLRKGGRYQSNFSRLISRCVSKYCEAAEMTRIVNEEQYMCTIIADSLDIQDLEWETYFNRTYYKGLEE